MVKMVKGYNSLEKNLGTVFMYGCVFTCILGAVYNLNLRVKTTAVKKGLSFIVKHILHVHKMIAIINVCLYLNL